jgi:hypothetical protein
LPSTAKKVALDAGFFGPVRRSISLKAFAASSWTAR